jgi:uncharacterized membrane protein YbhN (UPF0104 family)
MRVSHHAEGAPARAASSVVAERLMSVVGLLLLCLAGAAVVALGHPVLAVAIAGCGGGALALLILTAVAGSAVIGRAPSRWPGVPFISSMVDELRHVTRRREALRGLVLACAVQACTVVATWMLVEAVGAGVRPLAAMAVVPAITLFVLLPVSVQGIGVREATYVYFFGVVGVLPELAVAAAVLSYLTTLMASAIGGGVIVRRALRTRSESGDAQLEPEQLRAAA